MPAKGNEGMMRRENRMLYVRLRKRRNNEVKSEREMLRECGETFGEETTYDDG